MSETKYEVVQCRVPAGLLKEGETLEIRRPGRFERFITTSKSHPVIFDGACAENELRPVIIPAFDANVWAEKNLPKPACERVVWAKESYMFGKRSWYLYNVDPDHPVNKSSLPIRDLVGPDPFPLPWEQSKFKWCEVDREWRWVWQGGAS